MSAKKENKFQDVFEHFVRRVVTGKAVPERRARALGSLARAGSNSQTIRSGFSDRDSQWTVLFPTRKK